MTINHDEISGRDKFDMISMAERRRATHLLKPVSSIVLAEPLKSEVDADGNFTIRLNSGITLKATKSELTLFMKNIIKMLGLE